MTEMKRIMVTVDEETAVVIDKLKKEKFYDKPYSELYRYLLQLGIEKQKGNK